MNTELKQAEEQMREIFARAGIPIKEITLTRVTVIVKLYGEKHSDKIASLLKGAGWKSIQILDDRPTIYGRGKKSDWRVTGRL